MPKLSLTGRAAAALIGVAAGAVTVSGTEFLAGLWQRLGWAGGTPSAILALGGAFIDRTPSWLKDFAVATFGVHDKIALLASMAVVLVLAAAVAGVVAARSIRAGVLLVLLLVAVASAAVWSRPQATGTDVFPLWLGGALGIFALVSLRSRLLAAAAAPGPAAGARPPERRQVLRGFVAAGIFTVLGSVAGVALGRGASMVAASRRALRLPAAVRPGPSAAQLVDLGTPGASALLTPVADFYRIDTALAIPQVSVPDWRLRVHGLVENEFELDFAELLDLPMIETMATLSCVSNEVGGDLVGNQRWLGHPLRELLARAKPKPGADMVLSTSADGWTAGTPLNALMDSKRDALLAIGMAGEPLPLRHGFPARLVVPGLYGFVSATKWVVDLKVTTFAADEGYWTPRGWSALGPVKTQSRIDVPQAGAEVRAGRIAVAGVAWAPHRGIERVEVRVDDGPWQQATLGSGGVADSWRQWVWAWSATPGEHRIAVRATDGQGETQPELRTDVAPDGATGWHETTVTVR